MNTPEMLIVLMLLRLIIPFGSILLLGEFLAVRRRAGVPRG
jgi:hypothetical protein